MFVDLVNVGRLRECDFTAFASLFTDENNVAVANTPRAGTTPDHDATSPWNLHRRTPIA